MTPSRRRLTAAAASSAVIALASLLLPSRAQESDTAWLDRSGTADVVTSVAHVAQTILSVTPATVAQVRSAARASLAGDAVTQFSHLYEPVMRSTRAQGATLRTTVRAVSVTRLSGASAQALVIADQKASVGSASKAAAATFTVDLERGPHGWKITDIKVL